MQSNQNITKNTETGYKSGYPTRKGWYDCMIDEEPMRLYCFICELKKRSPYWVDEAGQKVLDPVVWR